jgi:hypothetical protein
LGFEITNHVMNTPVFFPKYIDVSAVRFLPGGWLCGFKLRLFSQLRWLGKNRCGWRGYG